MVSEPLAKRARTQLDKDEDVVAERVESDPGSSESDSSEDSSSDDSDLGDIQLDEEFAEEACASVGKIPATAEGAVIYMHKLLGTLHARRVEDNSRFVCGKLISDSFSRTEGVLRCAWPECKMCFGTRNR